MQMFKQVLCFVLISSAGFLLSCTSEPEPPHVLIVGGHEHHDFDRWFNEEDSAIIAETGARVIYTDEPDAILPQLSELDVLYLSNNQPLPDTDLHHAIHDFVESGNGLLLVHAATWFNWQDDWPEYYRDFVGGGTQSHPPLGEFEVYVVDEDHPVMAGVPAQFSIIDELYRFEKDEDGADIHVLAMGIEAETGEQYPVAWTVNYGDGRIVNITLGHDGDAHQHEAFRAMLQNSILWLTQN
jgi:uncharacterized protein